MSAELSSQDIYLFAEGTHRRLHGFLGAHVIGGGVRFAVWAPNARSVRVTGTFDGGPADLHQVDSSGIWSGWVAGAAAGVSADGVCSVSLAAS